MNRHDSLLGRFVPGDSWLHRMPTGPKWLLLFVPTLVVLLVNQWWAGVVLGAVAVLVLVSTRTPVRVGVWPGWGFLVLVGVLLGYQLVTRSGWQAGASIAANMLACLWLSRALTLTTPITDLVDAITRALEPLARIGVPAERIGLAVGIMLRSIPHLVGSYGDVRDAARARGLERNWFARTVPVVIGAVAYAQRTGDALTARGLGDDDVD